MAEITQSHKLAVKRPLEYKLTDRDLLDLWRFEEEQGNTVKGRMLSITTWLLAFAAGVLGFLVKELGVIEGKVDKVDIALVLSLLGLAICAYAAFMIDEFGGHMKRHWDSADWLRLRIHGLTEIKRKGGPEFESLGEHELPGICKRVLIVVIFFAVIFLVILVYSMSLLQMRQLIVSFFAAVLVASLISSISILRKRES